MKNSKPLMFLLSSLVFILNLPAALLIMCYGFIPWFGFLMSFHMFKSADELLYVIVAAVMFMTPFVLICSLEFSGVLTLPLSEMWIALCLFIFPFVYIVGWGTIIHYILNKHFNCEHGIWSLPGLLWGTDIKLPKVILCLYLPVLVIHSSVVLMIVLVNTYTLTFVFIFGFSDREFYQFCVTTFLNKHILALEPIIITIILIALGHPPVFILPAGCIGCIYFLSVTLLHFWQKMITDLNT